MMATRELYYDDLKEFRKIIMSPKRESKDDITLLARCIEAEKRKKWDFSAPCCGHSQCSKKIITWDLINWIGARFFTMARNPEDDDIIGNYAVAVKFIWKKWHMYAIDYLKKVMNLPRDQVTFPLAHSPEELLIECDKSINYHYNEVTKHFKRLDATMYTPMIISYHICRLTYEQKVNLRREFPWKSQAYLGIEEIESEVSTPRSMKSNLSDVSSWEKVSNGSSNWSLV